MKLSKELLAQADLHAQSTEFSQPVQEGLGKQITRVVMGKTAGARAKQEKEKSFDALRAGDTKGAEKHMQRHLSFEKLLGKNLNYKAIRALADDELNRMHREIGGLSYADPEHAKLKQGLKDEIVRRKSLKEDEQDDHVMLPEAVEQLNQLLAEGKISGFKPPFKYDSNSGVLNSVIDSAGKNVCDTKARRAAKSIADALNMFTKSTVSEAVAKVEYTPTKDDKRLEKLIKAAMNKGDDYTAKSYAKMAETSDGKKYLNALIRQLMKPLKESADDVGMADTLEVGDRVFITGKVKYQGEEGEITEFGKDKKFVVVQLDSVEGTKSFHSSDVTDIKVKYEDDEDDDIENNSDQDTFYVAVVGADNGEGGDGFVGKVTIIDGKWKELPALGEPHYKWGQKYMGYLSQSDVLQYIKKDFGRYYDVKGPFDTLKDARNEAEDSGLELDESVQNMTSSFMNKAFKTDVTEGWKKIHPESQERENRDREGRRVKTPDGEGVVTRERKVPTFSKMVPFVHEITVKLDSGKSETYRAKMVRFLKDATIEESAGALKAKETADFNRMMAGAMSRDEFDKKWQKGKYRAKSSTSKIDPTGAYKNLIKTVGEAITYTDIEDWKKAVKNSYPQHASKMRFNGRMEGGKMTVSAEIPGEDRCFGVWDQEDEKGEVLSEADKFRKGELVVDSTGKEFKVVSVDKNWDLLTVSSGGRAFMIDQNKVTKVNTKLTPKEQEIKELLANGTSPEEVADIMQMPVSKVTKFMESSNLERKQKRIGLMIDDYIKRSKATTNDIKKSHYLDMADQLRDKLAALKLTEADEPSEDEKENEQIIAKADEYRVRLYKDTETVDLLDGEETILVSMPLVIWKQLTRQ